MPACTVRRSPVQSLFPELSVVQWMDWGNLVDYSVFEEINFNCSSLPSHLACDEERVEAAKLLVEHGASIYIENKEEKTPLQIAKGGLGNILRRIIEGWCVYWPASRVPLQRHTSDEWHAEGCHHSTVCCDPFRCAAGKWCKGSSSSCWTTAEFCRVWNAAVWNSGVWSLALSSVPCALTGLRVLFEMFKLNGNLCPDLYLLFSLCVFIYMVRRGWCCTIPVLVNTRGHLPSESKAATGGATYILFSLKSWHHKCSHSQRWCWQDQWIRS